VAPPATRQQPFYPLFDGDTAGFTPAAAADANGEYDSDTDNKIGFNLRLQGMKLITPHLAAGGFASVNTAPTTPNGPPASASRSSSTPRTSSGRARTCSANSGSIRTSKAPLNRLLKKHQAVGQATCILGSGT